MGARWIGVPRTATALGAMPRATGPLQLICAAVAGAGVDSYDVNFDQQTVTVKGSLDAQTVLEKVSKTGKKTELVQ